MPDDTPPTLDATLATTERIYARLAQYERQLRAAVDYLDAVGADYLDTPDGVPEAQALAEELTAGILSLEQLAAQSGATAEEASAASNVLGLLVNDTQRRLLRLEAIGARYAATTAEVCRKLPDEVAKAAPVDVR